MRLFFLFSFLYSLQCSDENWFQRKCEPSCIFLQGSLDSKTLNSFPKNCSSICTDLVIDAESNLTEAELIPVFRNVKTIFGTILISYTNLTSLKFLAGLESLKCDEIPSHPDFSHPKNGLKLYDNFEMTEIGMLNWTNTSCSVEIKMYDKFLNFNVPNLKNFNSSDPNKHQIYIQYDYYGSSTDHVCFSLEEVSNFYGAENVVMSRRNQKYCDHFGPTVFGEKLCKIPENDSIKNLEENCQRIFGILKIGPGDEKFVYKLKNVTWIYGKLIVENTTLTSVDFLNDLGFVISFNEHCDTSSLQFSHNKNLMEIKLPNLKKVLGGSKSFVINGNNGNFANSSKFCCEIENGLYKASSDVPLIDRQTCEAIQEKYGVCENSESYVNFLESFIFSSLVFSFLF